MGVMYGFIKSYYEMACKRLENNNFTCYTIFIIGMDRRSEEYDSQHPHGLQACCATGGRLPNFLSEPRSSGKSSTDYDKDMEKGLQISSIDSNCIVL